MEKDYTPECMICRRAYNALGGDPLFCPECKEKTPRPERRRIQKMILKIRGQ